MTSAEVAIICPDECSVNSNPCFFLSSSIDFWDGQHLDSSLNGTQARGAPMNLLGIQMEVMQIWGSMLNFRACWILLMAEILHQLIWIISHYLHGFIHPRWCRISSINSINQYNVQHVFTLFHPSCTCNIG